MLADRQGLACCMYAIVLCTACGTFPFHSFARDQLTRPTSGADYQDPGVVRVEVTAPAKGYYLSSSARAAGEPFGNYRSYLLVNVGNANPVFAVSTVDVADPSNFNPEAPYARCGSSVAAPGVPRCPLTMELSVPVAFHLFWDAFTSDAPIVDTDYMFGGDLTGRISLVANHEQRFRAYWGHISTHVGDEYLNGARRDPILKFPRINPSYFPWRLGLNDRWYYHRTYTSAFDSYVQGGFQVEGSCLWPCDTIGYYQADATQTAGLDVPVIPNGVEWSATVDWRWYTGSPAPGPFAGQLRPDSWDVSILGGRRRVFPYLGPHPPDHDYQRVVNLIAGYTWSTGTAANPAFAQLYARFYFGPNPYGQLRNQRDFNFAALGLRLH
jgi:hypothetical protein